jgi:hypothetical protein
MELQPFRREKRSDIHPFPLSGRRGEKGVRLILSFSYYNMQTHAAMNEFKKIGLLIIGWIFIGLGILGLFLPVLQGILFIMIGLAILSSRSKTIRRFLTYLEKRYPQQYQRVVAWRLKIRSWFKKNSV